MSSRLTGLRAPLGLAAALIALLPSCRFASPVGVAFATTPPGARVLVDGRECGYVTPCLIDLDNDAHKISLVLPGYEDAHLRLDSSRDIYFVTWAHASIYPPGSFRFPLFLPAIDLFEPMRVRRGPEPSRVHVRMRPLGTE